MSDRMREAQQWLEQGGRVLWTLKQAGIRPPCGAEDLVRATFEVAMALGRPAAPGITEAQIAHIVETAAGAGLTERALRPLLLAWMPEAIVAALPDCPPSEQIESDVRALATAQHEGRPALAKWLENASIIAYTRHSDASRVLREARDALLGGDVASE